MPVLQSVSRRFRIASRGRGPALSKMRLVQPASFPGSSDACWELAQRVADSASLRNCPKLRAFLLYVCENTLAGQTDNVREQVIGSKVFGRPAGYNLGEDNIVRVEARELRKRLESYFAGEGRQEPLVIDIPKGGYIPIFRTREQLIPELESGTQGLAGAIPPGRLRGSPRRWLWVAGLVALLAVAFWLTRLRPQTSARSSVPEEYAFYSDLLGPLGRTGNHELLLVLSNPKVVLYYGTVTDSPGPDGQGRTVRAPAQLKKSFGDALNNIDRDSPYQFLHVTREDYTGMGESVAAFHLGRLLQPLHIPVRLTQGRFLTWDQVQKQNLILVGAPQINDWTYRNPGVSNFNVTAHSVTNAKPLPGEQAEYLLRLEPGAEPGTAITDYGVINMLISPHGYNMLLLAGGSSAGTAGVGEFFTNPAKMRVVYERIRAATPGKAFPASWEALIKIDVRDGLPVDCSALAVRPAATSR
jgi:hypothetical protein